MPRDTHQIVALLFSDVVGLARETDPERTAPVGYDQRSRERIRSIVERNHGDWLQEFGDAVLCTFASAAEAMRCALEIQRETAGESEFRPRIGIHCGDLAFQKSQIGTDAFGAAANVAARVQAVAERGGICITARVRQELGSDRSKLDFEYLGEKSLKNVDVPIGIYRVEPPLQPLPLAEIAPAVVDPDGGVRWGLTLAVVAGAALLAFGAAELYVAISKDEPMRLAEAASGETPPVGAGPPAAPVSPAIDEAPTPETAFAAVRRKLLTLEGKGGLAARIWTIPDPVKNDAAYQVGIETGCDCTALLFSIDGSTDAITLLYPNPFHPDASIRGGEALEIPASGEWIMRAVGGEGIDVIKLIVVDGPVELADLSEEAWSVTPTQTERIAELETLLASIQSQEWDAAAAPLQIVP